MGVQTEKGKHKKYRRRESTGIFCYEVLFFFQISHSSEV